MLFKFITILFLIWFVGRLLFRFILPIFRVATVANSRMRQMQAQMREMNERANNQNINNSNYQQPRTNGKKEGDYIDYEEVK